MTFNGQGRPDSVTISEEALAEGGEKIGKAVVEARANARARRSFECARAGKRRCARARAQAMEKAKTSAMSEMGKKVKEIQANFFADMKKQGRLM